MRQILDVLQDEKKLSEDEKILFAWSLAATPEQRWQRSQNVLRSLKEFVGRDKDLAALPKPPGGARRRKKTKKKGIRIS